jgi:hypothetical protein
MQTKGGGKHDILPVGRATATTLDCLWMMPRDPDADMCPGTHAAAGEHGGVHGASELASLSGQAWPTIPPPMGVGALYRAVSQVWISSTDGGVHDAQVQEPPS